ncbi:MAG: MgtC/SapB family protein [Lachnospiraceae bacterium]|nr:MgtC/SapB family protein [Lachnospiraceae bacterium]
MEQFFVGQGEFFIRLAIACICGGIIGIERQLRTKVAGVRTHIMICIGAALLIIISKYGFVDVAGSNGLTCDVSRVASTIITGIGIIGGGLIFTGKQGSISGITTAAGTCVTIGIGMAVGAGMYVLGVGAMILVVVIQLLLHINVGISKHPTRVGLIFEIEHNKDMYNKVMKELTTHKFSVARIKWESKSESTMLLKCQVMVPAHYKRDEVVDIFMGFQELQSFEMIQ